MITDSVVAEDTNRFDGLMSMCSGEFTIKHNHIHLNYSEGCLDLDSVASILFIACDEWEI